MAGWLASAGRPAGRPKPPPLAGAAPKCPLNKSMFHFFSLGRWVDGHFNLINVIGDARRRNNKLFRNAFEAVNREKYQGYDVLTQKVYDFVLGYMSRNEELET